MLSEATGVAHERWRAELDQVIARLKMPGKGIDGLPTREQLEAATAEFEEKSLDARRAALNTSIIRVGAEQNEFLWLSESHARFASQLRLFADRAACEDALDARSKAPYYAYALFAGGHECKWRLIAGRRAAQSFAHQHHMQLNRALAVGCSDVVVPVPIEGSAREASVESLYMRALLLERLASGNLTAQQIEILDDWLLAWMHSLMVSRRRPDDENALVADLTGAKGFVLALRDEPEGDPRSKVYLPLKPVMRQLDRAIECFHQGLIYPGFGLGMSFRIEEHVGVIDYLSREFEQLMARREFKQPRTTQDAAREVAVYVGMNDIVTRAVQLSGAALLRVADPFASAARTGYQGASSFSALDPAMRLLGLNDMSETGFGLLAGPDQADAFQIGDLAAVRLATSTPPAVCVVSRKVALPGGNQHLIGLRILTRVARPLALEFPTDGSSQRPPASAIFIPGDDSLGRGDSIIVSETIYRSTIAFRVTLGGNHFRVTLGRVKRQGRGWKMVAFDVVREPPRPADQPADAPPAAGPGVRSPYSARSSNIASP
jgi:hypothetical protein